LTGALAVNGECPKTLIEKQPHYLMIDENITVHDQYQFEIKLGYPVKKEAFTSYDIETYFFIPESLGINRYSYPKSDFYSDMKSYVRFRTPRRVLKNVLEGENCPWERVTQSLDAFIQKPTPHFYKAAGAFADFEHQTQMFCCITKGAFKQQIQDVISSTAADRSIQVLRYVEDVNTLKKLFREWGKKMSLHLVPQTRLIYHFANEFLSLTIEDYTFLLLEKLKTLGFPKELEAPLLSLIHDELNERRVESYPSIPEKGRDFENLLYRKSVLKKYMESVLFLKTHTEKEGRVLNEILFGVAAGFAMIFATAVLFFSSYRFGTLTVPVFALLVLSYMCKDRIKEWLRSYFNEQMQRFLFDHKTEIFYHPKKIIGWCKENSSFVKNEQIPEKIMEIRNCDHTTEIEHGHLQEKTIQYRRQIRIFNQRLKKNYPRAMIEGLTDIMRFNLSNLVKKMSDSKKDVFLTDGSGYYKTQGERIYHLNMIFKYSTGDTVSYQRYRIVLNREGIKRIEKVPASKSEVS